MESNEKFRGQTDGIILFILSKGERHADELKVIIDEYFAGVKIGTLYSIIARLKTQNLISEYRASSINGSRRKYFKLTDKGEKAYNVNYAKLFEGSNIELNKNDYTVDESVTEEIISKENDSETKLDNEDSVVNNSSTIYSQMINDTVTNNDYSSEIDFSSLETEVKVEENQKTNEIKSDFIPYDTDYNLPVKEENEVNLDSVLNSNYEYKSVLSKLYPKKVSNQELQEVNENDISDNVVLKEYNENNANWNEVYELAEKEGIKIRTSSDTNRYQGSKILVSRLLVCSSFIALLFSMLGYLLLTALIPNVKFKGSEFLTITTIFGLVFVILIINLLVNPSMQVKNLPKFINVIEIVLIILISTAIIAFSISAIKEIDYTNNAVLFSEIVFPIFVAFNLLIFAIITYILSKSEYFESL